MSTFQPPKAKKNPHRLFHHDHERIDDYFWLNDRENPEVIAYLEQENAYYQAATAHTKELQDALFVEMKRRIKEDDSSVPYFYNGYYYITRFEKGGDYPIYTRRQGSMEAPERLLFDANEMAKGHSYFHLTGLSISEDNVWVSFGVDTVSRRQYSIQIKNLETGEILPYAIDNTTGGAVWSADGKYLFYSRKDPKTLRSDSIYRHALGADPSEDVKVYFEADATFDVSVFKSKSREYIMIASESTLTSEYRFIKAAQPLADFQLFQPRVRGLEYSVSHYGSHFYILTNKDEATNFKLMKTEVAHTALPHWVDVLPHREDVLLEGIDIFSDFLVVSERYNGLNALRIIRWDGTMDEYLPFASETYTAYTTTNVDFDTPWLRYAYQSLATPASVIEFNMITREKRILKEQEVLGGDFDKHNYIEERIWATADDGVQVPISLVYKKGLQKNQSNPLLLYGYGSYGVTLEPYFSTTRLSLLDRGFVYAMAHVRGGEDLGRRWYETGKLLEKRNTFTDFINCAAFLIQERYTSESHLYAEGGSAGGLLVGAVANMRPDLFHGIIAQVPFVDVVTTMLDDTIPLTTGEYDEWGNPNDKVYYDYMLSYSPYDNVCAQDYPHMYISTGLHDSQVQYWEPAKWVAKLRAMKTDANQLFLDTNMATGHGGASGRFEALKEVAKEFAFLLDLEKIKS
ncbi:S9 family peptidase [Flavobacterium sp.]|jgi:oligopeptidase B|uniref:S9 family peptidase n=1 Tax=Flavobacterium sp. TaxID=239 RepID=UPI0022C6A532|nr:S9 family peptidase [Flavobacterium sp.]MCZ8144973.1 S9 family peptidase [Flavobacterium sp.]MCZ8368255.1 S9 family peptidase [Flavobacterium sp.]